MAANRVTHMIDPWPPASGNRNIAYSGEKAAIAAERYRTGRVIPPPKVSGRPRASMGQDEFRRPMIPGCRLGRPQIR